MSTFSEAKTYADLMLIFDNLSVQLDASRRALRPMPDLDARQVALRGMQEVLAGYAFGFSSMVYDRTQEQIIRSFGRSNVPPNEARRMVEEAWKNGLLVLFMFKVDVLLQNLLKAEGSYSRAIGAYGTMVARLIALSMPSDPVKTCDVLLTAGALRNSHHNNGMHRGESRSLDIHDMHFVLVKDQAIDCASWQHVLAILSAVVEELDRMLASAVIAALPSPIPDAYALNPVA